MLLIKNGYLFTEEKKFIKRDILLKNGIIERFDSENIGGSYEVIDASDKYVVPGFIDLHTHGAYGFDTLNSDYNSLNDLSEFFAKQGTTSFLCTIMSAPLEEIFYSLESIKRSIELGTKGASVIGINLEGPFINKEFKGSHNECNIICPDKKLIKKFFEISGGKIKIITVSPEINRTDEVLEYAKENRIVAAVGHSNLKYEQSKKAFDFGVSHITHIFNAMTSFHHREPGIFGACLENDAITAEMIADGIHIHPATVKMLIRCLTPERIALVTDSISVAGLKEGEYLFSGQKVILKDKVARLENGVLAGSTITMIDSIKKLTNDIGISLEDAFTMASSTPAKVIKIDARKGSLSFGKDADVVLLSKDLNVEMTIVNGKVVYSGKDSV